MLVVECDEDKGDGGGLSEDKTAPSPVTIHGSGVEKNYRV